MDNELMSKMDKIAAGKHKCLEEIEKIEGLEIRQRNLLEYITILKERAKNPKKNYFIDTGKSGLFLSKKIKEHNEKLLAGIASNQTELELVKKELSNLGQQVNEIDSLKTVKLREFTLLITKLRNQDANSFDEYVEILYNKRKELLFEIENLEIEKEKGDGFITADNRAERVLAAIEKEIFPTAKSYLDKLVDEKRDYYSNTSEGRKEIHRMRVTKKIDETYEKINQEFRYLEFLDVGGVIRKKEQRIQEEKNEKNLSDDEKKSNKTDKYDEDGFIND